MTGSNMWHSRESVSLLRRWNSPAVETSLVKTSPSHRCLSVIVLWFLWVQDSAVLPGSGDNKPGRGEDTSVCRLPVKHGVS